MELGKVQVLVFATVIFVATIAASGVTHTTIEHRREWNSRGLDVADVYAASLIRRWALASMNYLTWILPAVMSSRTGGARRSLVGAISVLSAVGIHMTCWALDQQLVLYSAYRLGALAFAGLPGGFVGAIAWAVAVRGVAPRSAPGVDASL